MTQIKIIWGFTPEECEEKANDFLKTLNGKEIVKVVPHPWGTRFAIVFLLKEKTPFNRARFEDGILKAAEYIKSKK